LGTRATVEVVGYRLFSQAVIDASTTPFANTDHDNDSHARPAYPTTLVASNEMSSQNPTLAALEMNPVGVTASAGAERPTAELRANL
jgi:hypothetical protein